MRVITRTSGEVTEARGPGQRLACFRLSLTAGPGGLWGPHPEPKGSKPRCARARDRKAESPTERSPLTRPGLALGGLGDTACAITASDALLWGPLPRHSPRSHVTSRRGRGSPVSSAWSRRHVLVDPPSVRPAPAPPAAPKSARSARGVTQPAGRFGKQRPGHAAASPRRGPGHSPGTCTTLLPAAAGLPAHSSPTAANSSPCPRRRTVSPLGGEASSSDTPIRPRAPTCATPRTLSIALRPLPSREVGPC